MSERPPHPYWCDDCEQRAPFAIPGCPIPHTEGCSRADEDPLDVYKEAVAWCRRTHQSIP